MSQLSIQLGFICNNSGLCGCCPTGNGCDKPICDRSFALKARGRPLTFLVFRTLSLRKADFSSFLAGWTSGPCKELNLFLIGRWTSSPYQKLSASFLADCRTEFAPVEHRCLRRGLGPHAQKCSQRSQKLLIQEYACNNMNTIHIYIYIYIYIYTSIHIYIVIFCDVYVYIYVLGYGDSYYGLR